VKIQVFKHCGKISGHCACCAGVEGTGEAITDDGRDAGGDDAGGDDAGGDDAGGDDAGGDEAGG